jgi:hypothetical protein
MWTLAMLDDSISEPQLRPTRRYYMWTFALLDDSISECKLIA